MYHINDVSREVNLSQKRIREYEKEGFINPDREPRTNNRLYTDFEVDQIKRINFLLHERGFTLTCLKTLMLLAPCWNIFACEFKEDCSAYLNPYKPCWVTRDGDQTKCPGPCSKCAIFLNRGLKKERILEQQVH